MNREQILARLAEIRSMIANPTEDMDIAALTEEVRSLKSQLALIDAVEDTAAENRSAVANGAGTPVANLADQAQARAAAPAVSPRETRAAEFVAHNSMRIPMFAEGRSVLVSSGKLALPKAVANEIGELLSQVSTQDLVKFGLIPEFVGRVPIRVALDGLDKESLVKILAEPKNALVKQYQKLFKYDDVKLVFEDDAIDAIAEEAFTQKTGARGLRTIMESAMMDVMFTIPSDDTVKECIITKDVIEGKQEPTIIR